MKFQKSSPKSPSVWQTVHSLTDKISVDSNGNVALVAGTGKYGDIYYRMVLDRDDVRNLLNKLDRAAERTKAAESEERNGR